MATFAATAATAFAALTGGVLDALLPKRCPLCATRENRGLCLDCRELLPWIMIGCEICGAELHEAGICGRCQSRPPYYDHAVIPFKYRAPLSAHISTLKYHDQLRHAHSLGAMICQRVWKDSQPPPERLIAVPLHRRRLRERGFNQSLEIARWIGGELGIEIDHSSLTRIRNTAPQASLGKRERERNVRGAFAATLPIRHHHVALVDDVVTTGNTANEAARALKRAGVERVSLWAAARA